MYILETALAERGYQLAVADLDFEGERKRVAAALRLLERRLDRLAAEILHCNGRFSVAETADSSSPARAIADVYTSVDYLDGERASASPVCLGVALVPAYVMELAASVNAAKEQFKAVCAPLQRVRQRVRDPRFPAAGTVPITVIRLILQSLGRSGLNLLAAYRRIPVLYSSPARICYTRAFTRSVYRKRVAQIAEMINRSERPGAKVDRARIARLPATETYVALVRERYENVRANVTFKRKDEHGRLRAQLGAELPLLIPAARTIQLPDIDYPAATDKARPRQRKPTRLQALRFLSSVPVYRYRTSSH